MPIIIAEISKIFFSCSVFADLSSSTLKRNADLEQRVAELEVELHVWKQAHSQTLEAAEAHNVQIAALNRQISGLDYFKSVSALGVPSSV